MFSLSVFLPEEPTKTNFPADCFSQEMYISEIRWELWYIFKYLKLAYF
jgi:hypothetical protein